MGKKTEKLNQGDSNFIKFFFDLFYRTNWNQNESKKKYFRIIDPELLPTNQDINVLICGAGSCIHELPVLLTLFESNKYEHITLTFVDKAIEPLKLLHFILKKYGETNCRDSIGKKEIANYFCNTQDYDIKTDERYSISNSKIEYTFHVVDLELDPHKTASTNRCTEFNEIFNGKEYNIVMMSMFLQHISYWRSLIAFLNEHLKDDGYFWINEFGKDDYLLTLDLYMAIIDNKRKGKEEWNGFEKNIIEYFENEYYNYSREKDQMLFSIISDNDEISPTNIEICRDFFDFFGSKGKMIFEEGFQSDIKNPSELFINAKERFSPFTKLHSLLESETLLPEFSENAIDELDFTMKWYAYPKVTDTKIKHFNVLDDAKTMEIPVLQQYINRTLDILNLNSTIFRPTFLRREDTSEKLVKLAVELFRRFQLFKIGDFQSIVFYIPGITTIKCFNDTTKNFQDDFNSQNKFHIKIDEYNEAIKDTGESNSALFFDKYKTIMTKPFSIFLEPLKCYKGSCEAQIEYQIDEYGHSPNQKVHIIKVAGKRTDSKSKTIFDTPLGVSYNYCSLTTLYSAFNKHFNEYRSILIPCFREPLFDKNKEFLGDLIMFQKRGDNNDDERDDTPIEFFSWLIRKFLDFTQIATYFDYKRIILQSLKSAIAAIMSRNMSHNLGSHFISNTKNYFSTLIECDPNNKENYRGIKHSLQYIQERMDFIATITSTDTYPFGAVNAKAQIFDELTPDDFGKRHGQKSFNFLMDNLVLSERISKQSRGGKDESLSKLKLQIGHWDGSGDPVFWDPTASNDEDNQKRDQILGINFAIPGGILGRHAVFSIIENIIRNAAKHGQGKILGDFIVRMLYRTDEKRLIVFDNKNDGDIKGTVEKMNRKLKTLQFLTPEGALEQESKGLKEMLICAIWLQNENVSQVMAVNDSKKEEDRLTIFNKYITVVAVDENGKELKDNDTKGFLGYSIKLDQYERVHYLKEKEITLECLRNIKADVVCYSEDRVIGVKKLSDIFPRFLVLSSENDVKSIGEVEVLRRVVEKNCGSKALQRKMVVEYTTDYKNNLDVISYKNWNQKFDAFLFKGHAGKSKWEMFETLFLTKGFEDKYVDAISGGDFTYTLVQPSFVNDEYNLLKIKESVATRFVIIDERIFEHYKSMTQMTCEKGEDILEKSKEKSRDKVGEYVFKKKQVLGNGVYSTHEKELDEFVKNTTALSVFLEKDIEQHYLERKGIYVFNLESKKEGFKMVDLSSNGKEFMWNTDKMKFDSNDKPFDTKPTTFLSVHLGLIDKIKELLLKSGENKVNGDAIDKEIVEALKLHFGASFVSIHSGRGGFDIRESLRQYAFQSFSAIENPLYNSKFLLAQQFYNLNYYGTK